MASALVARYGEQTPDGARSFSTPERLSRVRERELRGGVRAGYRSPYLVALSRQVARGEADPASWDTDGRDASVLRKEILALPGIGPYVAENILKYWEDRRPRARFGDAGAVLRDVPRRKVKDRSIERRLSRSGGRPGSRCGSTSGRPGRPPYYHDAVNALDIGLCILLVIGTVLGLMRGLVRIVIGLLTIIVAFFLASRYQDPLAGSLTAHDVSETPARIAAYAIVFIGTMIAGGLVAWVVGRFVRLGRCCRSPTGWREAPWGFSPRSWPRRFSFIRWSPRRPAARGCWRRRSSPRT